MGGMIGLLLMVAGIAGIVIARWGWNDLTRVDGGSIAGKAAPSRTARNHDAEIDRLLADLDSAAEGIEDAAFAAGFEHGLDELNANSQLLEHRANFRTAMRQVRDRLGLPPAPGSPS